MNVIKKCFGLIPLLFLLSCNNDAVELTASVVTYPNPFQNEINLRIDLVSDAQVKVYLYNPNEKAQTIIFSESSDNPVLEDLNAKQGLNIYKIDFSSLSSGAYLLDVVINGKTQRQKIIKK